MPPAPHSRSCGHSFGQVSVRFAFVSRSFSEGNWPQRPPPKLIPTEEQFESSPQSTQESTLCSFIPVQAVPCPGVQGTHFKLYGQQANFESASQTRFLCCLCFWTCFVVWALCVCVRSKGFFFLVSLSLFHIFSAYSQDRIIDILHQISCKPTTVL